MDKLDDLEKRVAFSGSKRVFDSDAPLIVDYEGHPSNCVGTNRAPVEHELARY